MNKKFVIFNIIQFAQNNMEQAYNEMLKLISGGSMLSNGEIDKIEEGLKQIKAISIEFREKLAQARELDKQRLLLVETAKEYNAIIN